MMTQLSQILILSAVAVSVACGNSGNGNGDKGDEETPIIIKQRISYADPTIFLDGDKYYLSGTSQIGDQSNHGFTVLVSDDLKEWTSGSDETYRFILNPDLGTAFGKSGFWAPQWFKVAENDYRLLYTANEKTAIAKADKITGLFTQSAAAAIDPSVGNIDPYLFKDDDGQYYLYHVRFGGGNFIWAAKFDIETGTIDSKSLAQCLDISQSWETMFNYDRSKVMEGPTVVKWDGVYYLFYSANHYRDMDYAVGYATASSPMGPWTKYDGNPILRRDIVGEKGSGHGDIFQGKDGQFYYVYHVWGPGDKADERQTRIVPLIRKKNADGIYEVSVNSSEIITPYQLIEQ